MSDENFAIICDQGDIISVSPDLLKRIPYFKSIFDGGYAETIDKTIDLSGNSKFACDNILAFVQDDRIDLPVSSLHCQECLGLAQYWALDAYVKAFLDKCIAEYSQEKGRIVEIINYIALTDKMSTYRQWLGQQVSRLPSVPRIHMLCLEAVQGIVALFSEERQE